MCISVSGSDLRLVYLLQLIHRGTGKVLLECSLTGLQGYLIRPGEPNGVCWFIKFVDKCQFDINNLQPAGQAPPINAADTAYHCYLLSNNHTTFAITGVCLGSVTLPGWPNPSPKRLYLCRSYRGEGDLEGEFLRRRRLSPCLARPGDLERDNDLDREDSARRPYLLPGDRDLPIFRCAPMHAAVKRRRAAVEGQCQLLSSEKTSAPPQSFWKMCFWKSFWRIYGLHEKYRNPNRGGQAQSGQKAAARPNLDSTRSHKTLASLLKTE